MSDSTGTPLITNDIVVLGLIAATLGAVFWTASLKAGALRRFYAVVPPLLLCYLLPGLYNSFGLIDGQHSQLYNPVASRVLLPAALVLLTLSVDLRAIARLGWKLVAMYAATSASIMLGAVGAFELFRIVHPATVAGDTWAGMAALAGSWIGGGANMLAMKEIFDVDATTFGRFAVVDVGVAYVWMALLIFLAPRAAVIDRRLGADTRALDALRERLASYREQHARIASLGDLMLIVGIAFGTVGLAHAIAGPFAAWLGRWPAAKTVGLAEPFIWIVGLCTVAGLGLSLTPLRRLEGAGASTLGQLFLYFLIACIGMQMDVFALLDRPGLFLLGVAWLAIHVVLLWLVARLLRAPLFYFTIGSMSHIGGPASAPVVASEFHPALAPVGALLGTLGYATGTGLAWLTGLMLEHLAGTG
jgi:uncharacterized membrane protein